MPTDLFAKLAKGKTFTKLDLSHAYQQLKLHPDSKKYIVVNTHKGLYRYMRLPCGISSAPSILQRPWRACFKASPTLDDTSYWGDRVGSLGVARD